MQIYVLHSCKTNITLLIRIIALKPYLNSSSSKLIQNSKLTCLYAGIVRLCTSRVSYVFLRWHRTSLYDGIVRLCKSLVSYGCEEIFLDNSEKENVHAFQIMVGIVSVELSVNKANKKHFKKFH